MSIPLYKLVDARGMSAVPALSAYGHLCAPHGSPTIILKRAGRQEYYVVDTYDWCDRQRMLASWFDRQRMLADKIAGSALLDDIAEIALHQAAERFDTLEQALLYFNAVAV